VGTMPIQSNVHSFIFAFIICSSTMHFNIHPLPLPKMHYFK
jgi:hypothetical protein